MSEISVLLTPAWDGEKIPSLGVCIRTDLPVRAGSPLFHINTVTIFKPFTELAEPIRLSDCEGEIAVTLAEGSVPPVRYSEWIPLRDGKGETCIAYTLKLAPAGRNPVFDLGYEPGGMTGSGMTFLPAFHLSGKSISEEAVYGDCLEGEAVYRVSWDLSALPERAAGVWSFGEGGIVRRGDGGLLMNTFYAAGLLDCVRLGSFGYYWFPNEKIPDSAMETARIFDYERRFFGDRDEPYTIFARHTSDPESDRAGGTALTRSYMYLYLNDGQIDPVWLKFLFAHEMVHNWVHLADEPFGTCTWYVEGMAEYYSAVLTLRMGLVSAKELADELNKRAGQYYENPAAGCSNAECGSALMADKEKTRVPYGRGFFYLTHADAAIRRASGGKHCLDDVVSAVNSRYEKDSRAGNEAWLEAYGKYVGADTARREYEFFRDGGIVTPETDCFEGKITARKEKGSVRGSGESCDLWRFEPRVTA